MGGDSAVPNSVASRVGSPWLLGMWSSLSRYLGVRSGRGLAKREAGVLTDSKRVFEGVLVEVVAVGGDTSLSGPRVLDPAGVYPGIPSSAGFENIGIWF